ncbi:DUF6879 family protein [Nonomuraea sp. NPDC050556]|uniref:DUF6879 family protein n=1 Tax=Nonomuraea sp. NPDC050556 TaxID=3364369 RepID=UPI0037B56299
MEQLGLEQWEGLFTSFQETAWHLELRDSYAVDDEQNFFDQWREGKLDLEAYKDSRHWWLALMRQATATGRQVRRARVVSEPVSEYIAWEYAGSYQNVEAGEEIAWLPRHQAGAIALPANDFWLFDESTVVLNYWTGAGEWLGNEVTEDPALAELCATSFKAVWGIATPHSDYHLI